MTPARSQVSRIYERELHLLVRDALRASGNRLRLVRGSRQRELSALRRDRAQALGMEKLRSRLHENGSLRAGALRPDDFETISGKITPILRAPDCMKLPLGSSAVAAILAVPELKDLRRDILGIFERSDFRHGFRRYRMMKIRGEPAIRGEDRADLRSLAGISHELGHCLFELGKLRIAETSGDVESEAVAQILEEWIPSLHLRRLGMPAEPWHNYQRKVDAVNYLFFDLEASEVLELSRSRTELPYSEECDVLRESVYALPGYQSVYAAASLIRSYWNERKIGLCFR